MMRTRCSLFSLPVLVAVFTLLASGGANGQTTPDPVIGEVNAITAAAPLPAAGKAYSAMTLTWQYGHSGELSDARGLGFNVYYKKGDDVALLRARDIDAASMKDASLGSKRTEIDGKNGTLFEYTVKELEPGTEYLFTVLPYVGEPAILDADPVPPAAKKKTADAPMPTLVRDVEVMSGDKMLMVSWRPPVRAAGSATDIKLDRYEVQWRWSQTADHDSGDWEMYPPKGSMTKLTDTKYDITSLENEVMYDVQVRAINEAKGKGPWSPAAPGVRGTPMAGGTTPTPTPTPALPFFGAFALGAGVLAAGRARLRRRAAERRQLTTPLA